MRYLENRKSSGPIHTIPVSDICVEGKQRLYRVAQNAKFACLLYIVIDAQDVKQFDHIGKLVRRVCDVHDPECTQFYSTGIYRCQRVILT